MPNPVAERAFGAALQLRNAVNHEAASADWQGGLRIADGLAYFSHKAPGLRSAIIGRGAKLGAVRTHLKGIADNFQSNRMDLSQNSRESMARRVRNEAAALSRRAEAAIASKGDISVAD